MRLMKKRALVDIMLHDKVLAPSNLAYFEMLGRCAGCADEPFRFRVSIPNQAPISRPLVTLT